MQAVRYHTEVRPDGKVELPQSALKAGSCVEVIVLGPDAEPEFPPLLAATAPADPVPSIRDIDDLSKQYVIPDRTAVSTFLQRNPEVFINLAAAVDHIVGIWGKGASVNLEVLRTMDDGQDNTLMAYIQTSDGVDIALAKLSQFTSRWWGDAWPSAAGKLNFDVEQVDAI